MLYQKPRCNIAVHSFHNQTTKMNTQQLSGHIEIEGKSGEIWTIKQDWYNQKFYITSTKGYNGYEGDGHVKIEQAIKRVNEAIKND